MTPRTKALLSFGVLATASSAAVYLWQRRKKRPSLAPHPHPHSLVIQPVTPIQVTRQNNHALRLSWAEPVAHAQLFVSQNPRRFPAAHLLETKNKTEFLVAGLDPAVRHYFKLVLSTGQTWVTAERFLPLQKGVNVRDIGGYQTADGRFTRWGRLYRSGDLSTLNPADVAYLTRLKLHLICDLRTSEERVKYNNHLPTNQELEYWHQPIYEREGSSSHWLQTIFFQGRPLAEVWQQDIYIKRFLEDNALSFGRVLRHMANERFYPALYHCTAGKDRTGLSFALLLSALGVPRETIVADYTLSNLFYDHILSAVEKDAQRLAFFGIQTADLFPILTAQDVVLITALDHLEKEYGSVENYLLKAAGLDEVVLAQLRQNLLEK